jgi:hypothetical protein
MPKRALVVVAEAAVQFWLSAFDAADLGLFGFSEDRHGPVDGPWSERFARRCWRDALHQQKQRHSCLRRHWIERLLRVPEGVCASTDVCQIQRLERRASRDGRCSPRDQRRTDGIRCQRQLRVFWDANGVRSVVHEYGSVRGLW